MNLTERLSVCTGSNCWGFWLRVFPPVYSRNIWSRLAVIVGFAATTVCSVRSERGNSVEKEMLRNFLEIPRMHYAPATINGTNCHSSASSMNATSVRRFVAVLQFNTTSVSCPQPTGKRYAIYTPSIFGLNSDTAYSQSASRGLKFSLPLRLQWLSQQQVF